jgi:hypothetical protein
VNASRAASWLWGEWPGTNSVSLIPLNLIPNVLDPYAAWLTLPTPLSQYNYYKKTSFLFISGVLPQLFHSLYKWRANQESTAALRPIDCLVNRKLYSGLPKNPTLQFSSDQVPFTVTKLKRRFLCARVQRREIVRRSGGKVPLTLDLGIWWKWVIGLILEPLTLFPPSLTG